MASKTLTAKVRLDTKSAEASLDRLAKKITKVQSAMNKTSRKGGLEQSVNKAVLAQEKLKQATLKTQLAEEKLTAQKQKTVAAAQRTKRETDKAANSASKLSNAFKASNTHANGLLTTVRRLAATYLGVMGMKAITSTSDTITSTQNKLNALNGNNSALTQEQMDKMYVSANKVRMAYTDMMANASKSMTLAGNAFQGNMDNAIRFQEIMAETYALGGASAPEMSTSMYQMIQALGAGTLAGDELRSVREGAPLAYKAIEEFAQGIYNTTESLKDLASQGKITSDMVVAAIMSAGDRIDAQFEETVITFGQAWNRIKNAAVQAFRPVSDMLSDMLNRAAENGAFEKIEQAFWNISKAIQVTFKILEKAVNWVIDNWDIVQNIIVAGLLAIGAAWAYQAGEALVAFIAQFMVFGKIKLSIMLILALIAGLIYIIYLFKTGAIEACDAMAYGLILIGVIGTAVAALLGAGWYALIGLVLVAAGLILLYFAECCGGIMVAFSAVVNAFMWCCNLALGIWNWVCAVLGNAVKWIANFFIACFNLIAAQWHNRCAEVVNLATAMFNVLKTVCDNIGIAFENAWIWAQNSFWSFLGSVMSGLSQFSDVIEAIASALGIEGFSISTVVNSVNSKQQGYKSFKSVGDAWTSGMNTVALKDFGEAWSSGYNTYDYANLGDAWSSGWNTYDAFGDGWASQAYNKGYDWGQHFIKIANFIGSLNQNGIFGGKTFDSLLEEVGKKLGLDLSSLGSGFPSGSDYDVSGAYNPVEDLLAGLADDVGSIKDSVELSEEDLTYLRKIAEMEWEKKYTSNNVTIDMTNYNNVNGESDLDGIVTKLADKLYEELNVMADGVYA